MNSPWSFIIHGSLIFLEYTVSMEDILSKSDNVDMILYCSASWHPHILCGYFCFQNQSWLSKLENEINLSDEAAIFCAWNLGKTHVVNWHQSLHDKDQVLRHFNSQFNWWIYLGFMYITVLLLSDKEYSTRFHPRVSVAQCLVPEYFNFFSDRHSSYSYCSLNFLLF